MEEPTYELIYRDETRDIQVALHRVTGLQEILDGVQSFLQAVGFVFEPGDRLEMVDEHWRDAEEERPDLWNDFMEEEKV